MSASPVSGFFRRLFLGLILLAPQDAAAVQCPPAVKEKCVRAVFVSRMSDPYPGNAGAEKLMRQADAAKDEVTAAYWRKWITDAHSRWIATCAGVARRADSGETIRFVFRTDRTPCPEPGATLVGDSEKICHTYPPGIPGDYFFSEVTDPKVCPGAVPKKATPECGCWLGKEARCLPRAECS